MRIFPILSHAVYGKLVYFDNGATTQKPRLVVDSLVDEYYSVNANGICGVHYLSQQATETCMKLLVETVRQFINAHTTNEVIFTREQPENINLLVSSFGDEFMEEGDEVILPVMEHHSNIVPWQLLAARKGIAIKVIPMDDKGELLLDEDGLKQLLERTKIVSVVQVSNVLGM